MSEPFDKLLSALRSAGWLVGKPTESAISPIVEPGGDLLPLLRSEAIRLTDIAESSANQQRLSRLVVLLDWLTQRGAKLTVGWPHMSDRTQRQWLGCRLMWWPEGVASGRKIAWVSSRLGRTIDERPDWFGVLRTAAAKIDADHDLLLTSSMTTVDRFLERAAILFGLRLLRIDIDEQRSLTGWLVRLRRRLWCECLAQSNSSLNDLASGAESAPRLDREISTIPHQGANAAPLASAMLSPLIDAATIDPTLATRPLADRVLVASADQIVALQLRANGNLHDLLRRRLNDSLHEPGSVWLAWGDRLVSPEIVAELQLLGAVSWHLQPKDSMRNSGDELNCDREGAVDGPCESPLPHGRGSKDSKARSVEPQFEAPARPSEILPKWPWVEGEYLLHWTRRRSGPWPDQSAAEFVDELLLAHDASGSSDFAALVRIAQQRRLIASASNVRDGYRVVSFSATPIGELATKRTFRVHRTRLDFELFGIGLRRDWLIARSARPVCYGDDSLWPTLADDERPFFQLRQTRGRRGAAIIDWSCEAEWRIVGNVDLPEASSREIILFVPSDSDAKSLAAVSPWPVVVVPVG